ncbi:FAD-dependent oxidoreductase [Raoultibacter timonensis]|uniref:Fumarate reductase n=1 Tax=Raoultibacter timonensis TaxID=1907662 RepID=A0ABN6MBX1_9ACTN|nr:FAD-binding protein [Raoultibacter timonensis]BDE95481.1 fumarate reductase [Raoultibacter timonensis]BDF50085.1 fumarate reductase [Raoultibacter timonensis]
MAINRRQFLKGTVAIGGVTALGGLLSGCQPADQPASTGSSADASFPKGTVAEDFENSVVELEPIAEFIEEKTYDIVVVGAGTAGVPAVCTALEEGATVACLQKESIVVAHGNGSSGPILEESNDIGKLQYKQEWRKTGGYRMNPDLLDLYVEHAGEMIMWMMGKADEVGLPPQASKARTDFDEGSYITVASNFFGPKPINNQDIMTKLAEAAAADGAEFFYSTPAVQLIQADDGSVTGVIGKTNDGYIKFNASKAVIVAAGDYQNNESLVERYSPDVVRFQRKQANKTADGILMNMLAGGRMVPVNHAKTMHDMDAGPMMLTGVPFMALNNQGKRFMNEDIPMESWDLSLQWDADAEDPGRFFRIFDNDFATKYNAKVTPESLENYIPGLKDNPEGVYTSLIDTHRADSLDELAQELGLPADALKESVANWNAFCENGVDEEFGLAKDKLRPIDTPPYWGIRQWIRCSAINAGVVIDGCCRVLDQNNEPIPGLYSVGSGAGNVCGGLEWNLYQGGLCCGSYMTMGRYAAIHALTGDMKPSNPASYDEAKGHWAS